MATLHLICGLPGAGKTTLALELERSLPALRLTPDEWITQILGPRPPRDQLDAARDPFEALQWKVAARALALGLDVILDFGFWSRAEREDFRARASSLGAGSQVHLVDASEDVLLARLATRAADQKRNTFVVTPDDLRAWSAVFERPDAEELRTRTALPVTIEFTCHAAPVQAEGSVANHAFDFRARGEEWTFTMEESGWHRSGEVSGGRFAASYLPLDQARALIHRCAREYLDSRAN